MAGGTPLARSRVPGAGDEGGGSSCCDYVASDFVSLAAQLGRPSHPPRREQAFLLALPDLAKPHLKAVAATARRTL